MIGTGLASVTRPKPSITEFQLGMVDAKAQPRPSAVISGTVKVMLLTPPEL
jgi:hypothetical protein